MIVFTLRFVFMFWSEHTHDEIVDFLLILLILDELELSFNESIHEVDQKSEEQLTGLLLF